MMLYNNKRSSYRVLEETFGVPCDSGMINKIELCCDQYGLGDPNNDQYGLGGPNNDSFAGWFKHR